MTTHVVDAYPLGKIIETLVRHSEWPIDPAKSQDLTRSTLVGCAVQARFVICSSAGESAPGFRRASAHVGSRS